MKKRRKEKRRKKRERRGMLLSQANPEPREADILFDEPTHVYTIVTDPGVKYESVTTFIHHFFEEFDAKEAIRKMRNGRNWNEKNQYFNMTDDEIMAFWEKNKVDASTAGTNMHNNLEKVYNQEDPDPEYASTKEYLLFLEYLQDYNYRAYRTELRVYTEIYKKAGSIDMIYHDPCNPGKFIICDWKRSKEIKYNNPYQKGKGVLSHIDDCNFWHYTLQLNMYKYILERHYHKQITGMFLARFHPNQEHYLKIDIADHQDLIQKMLDSDKEHRLHANV